MEQIETYKKYLQTVHPVRRTGGQKAEFRQWTGRQSPPINPARSPPP